MSDLRSMCEAMLRKQAQKHAQIKHAEETIIAFDKQWLENDYLLLDDLLWVLAEASPDNRDAYILPIIQSAITSKALTVWDENKSFRLNDKVLHTQYISRKTLVFKKDFLVWLKQTNAVPFPQRLIDLGGCDIHVTPDIENLIAENEDLKTKVAELENKLSRRIDVRTEKTHKNLIAALLDCINGGTGIDKHPAFKNESELIAYIDKQYTGYYGLTQSNLSKKLPEIKQSFQKEQPR